MKSIISVILFAGLLTGSGIATAAEDLQVSRSAGKVKADDSIDLSQLLQSSDKLRSARTTQDESYAASSQSDALAGIANRHDQVFEIFQANAYGSIDLDGDGFRHQLTVNFDIDVNVEYADVYTKLYLSRNGEPWSHFYTTDIFHIEGDSYADEYEVTTELFEGYAPGYYAVLVEVYSLDHAYMVSSEVLDYHYMGRDLPLEDLSWDDPYYFDVGYYSDDYYEASFIEVGVSGGAGSFALLLFFIFLQVVIAARGILSLTPCKTIIKNRNP
ncbi:MAG: hypothetical protein ACI9LO_003233 [Planctomycetota bacterium]|jgi:hypothetical protein